MQWFTGNVGLHHVHHLNAKIPFYRLPEAMNEISEFQTPGTTSLHPLDVVRCLRLNLWDPDQGRLVSYREARRYDRRPQSDDGEEHSYDPHSYDPDVLDEPAASHA